MAKEKLKILLAEDDVNLGFLLVDFLESKGFEVKLYKDGQSALTGFHNLEFDFCLLDIMMPRLSGYELAEEIRKSNKIIPIVFLTAKSEKTDKIKGYRLGIDDYVTKPFDEDLLVCKIQAISNRMVLNETEKSEISGSIGSFTYNPTLRQLTHTSGKAQRLTAKENAVLEMLCLHKNEVVERETILTKIWGENDYFTSRSLDVFVTKLRKYLKEDEQIKIENIPNLGLSLVVEG